MNNGPWPIRALSDVARIERTGVAPEAIPTGTNFVGLENIVSSGVFNSVGKVANGELKSTKFRFTTAHILYGKLRPYLSKIARPDFDGVCSTDILPVMPSDNIDRDYLYYYLRQPDMVDFATARCSGANLPRLSPKELEKFPVPLPPLAEQRRIAAILDKADAIRRKRQQAIQLTEQFLKSAFLDMFGDPMVNPRKWPLMRLSDVCSRITDGTHDSPKRQTSGIPFITGKHIRPFVIDFDRCDFLTVEDHKEVYRRCNPTSGDVLYTNIGVNLGTAALCEVDFEFSMKNVALLKLHSKIAVGRYIEHLLNAESMKKEIVRIASLGGAQSFLSLDNIRKLEIPIPDRETQAKFAGLARSSGVCKAKLGKYDGQLQSLFSSLVQRAFRGELTSAEVTA
jgi:type I restriction enzyme S subunit